jgi:hypothetical protein
MNLRRFAFQHRYMALALAVLALWTQFLLTQLSTDHLARVLWQQSLRADVCSVYAFLYGTEGTATATATNSNPSSGPNPSPSNTAYLLSQSCPLCSMAGTSLAPGHAVVALDTLLVPSPYRSTLDRSPVWPQPWPYLRPPAQAPPRA